MRSWLRNFCQKFAAVKSLSEVCRSRLTISTHRYNCPISRYKDFVAGCVLKRDQSPPSDLVVLFFLVVIYHIVFFLDQNIRGPFFLNKVYKYKCVVADIWRPASEPRLIGFVVELAAISQLCTIQHQRMYIFYKLQLIVIH